MIAGHAEHVMARRFQPFEELARLLELLGPRALGEVARNDDQVGLRPRRPTPRPRSTSRVVMRAEVQVGKMGDAGHVRRTAVMLNLFQHPSW